MQGKLNLWCMLLLSTVQVQTLRYKQSCRVKFDSVTVVLKRIVCHFYVNTDTVDSLSTEVSTR